MSHQVVVCHVCAGEVHATQALHQGSAVAVGHVEQFHYLGQYAHGVEVVEEWCLDRVVLLAEHADQLSVLVGIAHQSFRRTATCVDGQQCAGEWHHAAQRQYRNLFVAKVDVHYVGLRGVNLGDYRYLSRAWCLFKYVFKKVHNSLGCMLILHMRTGAHECKTAAKLRKNDGIIK